MLSWGSSTSLTTRTPTPSQLTPVRRISVGLCQVQLGLILLLRCVSAPYNQGAQVSDYYYTYSGDEETLAKLVFQHGAAVTSVKADGPFQVI